MVPDDFDTGERMAENPGSAEAAPAIDDDATGSVAAPVIKRNGGAVREHRLLFPPNVDGRRMTRVAVRLPEQGDIDDWAAGTLPDVRAVVLRLTGLHPAVLKALTWQDSEAVHLIVQDILPAFIVNSEDPT